MLEIKRERMYGIGSAKHVYRARVGHNDVATGTTRNEALENAWRDIDGALTCSLSRVHVAVAVDGAVLTCREYAPGQYELMFHRAPALNGLRSDCGSEMGGLQIDGRAVTVYQMLEHRVSQYNQAVA